MTMKRAGEERSDRSNGALCCNATSRLSPGSESGNSMAHGREISRLIPRLCLTSLSLLGVRFSLRQGKIWLLPTR